ncbi:unnamed protein product [Arabidopsis thaliana]|uniref:Similarity to protein kinase n=1 Tax=Arabidopsis thaliana TaxID=3702 RepID=Q9FGG9_ARATH|nr:unnamed protein product [Arabidopsis thaliana]
MAAALECWSSRAGDGGDPDNDLVDQVLMRTHDRSESVITSLPETSLEVEGSTTVFDQSSSAMQKRFQRLSRNVSEAIVSLKNTLNLDSARDNQSFGGAMTPKAEVSGGGGGRKLVWATVVKNLAKMYPGSQLPEKLVSNLKKHYDSLPFSYSQADFDMKEVFLHVKLIEQAAGDDNPVFMIQEVSTEEPRGSVLRLTFACNSFLSWSTMSGVLDSASICCKKIQIFEKKGLTLGVVLLLDQSGQHSLFKTRVENTLKVATKKPKPTSVKLPFGLCGCQEQNGGVGELGGVEEESIQHSSRLGIENLNSTIQIQVPLPSSSFAVSVDEWQTIQSGGNEIGKWLLNSDSFEFGDQIGPTSLKGIFRGKRVGIEKLKGCDKGNSYEFELRKDYLELMACGHKSILQFYGVCIDENHGLCVVTKLMEGGSLHELMLKNKKLQTKQILRIAIDIAEGLKFVNDHGVAYRDLNTQRILLDKHGNACLGNIGIVTACKSFGEAVEYETDGYRWLAPEMSNAYSFGMVLWEMVTGEAAYASCSPVQAAVGIAACGLRPEIPKECPQVLRTLMINCWNNSPSKRPNFSHIHNTLLRAVSR